MLVHNNGLAEYRTGRKTHSFVCEGCKTHSFVCEGFICVTTNDVAMV